MLLILGTVSPAGATQGRPSTVAVPPLPQRIWAVEVDGGDVTWLTGSVGAQLRPAGVNAIVVDRGRVNARDVASIRHAAAVARVGVLVVDSAHASSTVMAKRITSYRNIKHVGLTRAANQRLVLLVPLQKGKFSNSSLKTMIVSFIQGTSDLAVSLPGTRADRLPVLRSFLDVLRKMDKTPPTQPAQLSAASRRTSLRLGWRKSTDKSKVRYRISLNGSLTRVVSTTNTTISGLSCSTAYTLGVTAIDTTGNLSRPATGKASTAACSPTPPPGSTPPTTPTGLAVTQTQPTSVSLAWTASTDDVGVAGYGLYLNNTLVGTSISTTFPFSALTCATTYTFGVDAYDAAGARSPQVTLRAATAPCVAGGDTIAPTVPAAPAVTSASPTSLSLSWGASIDNVGVAGYGVYRNGSLLGSTTATGYSVDGLACGTSYTLAVDAFDAAGNRSASAPVTASTSACPVDTTAPSVPGSLAASGATQTAITLSWAASTDNTAVAGYGVYRNGALQASPTSPSYTVTGLTCGTSYTLAVDAFDAAGNRSASATLSASTAICSTDTTAPSVPGSLAASGATRTAITLSWAASTDNVSVAGYGVYRNGTWLASPASPGYTFTGLTCGSSYTLSVDAFDAAGNRSAKGSVSASTAACPADTTPPTVPTNEHFTGTTKTTISVAWNASTDNVAVTGYRAYLNGASVGTTSSASYIFAGLTCGTSYTISISAYDAAGNASNPSLAAGTTSTSACSGDTLAPTTPTGLAVTSATQTSIALFWSASIDNVAVTGYGAYRNGALQGSSPATSYSYTGLTCGTTYTLAVDAYDAAGNRSAIASLSASTAACVADTVAPSVPGSLAASAATQTSITLTWGASTDNVGVSGYGVYRNGSSVGSTASTSYSYTGLACGSSYTLAVDAYDAAGNRSSSASVSGATAACGASAVANLWMSTTAGGSCSRSAAGAPFNQATSCSDAQSAFTACQAGDLIGVQAGSYGSQTVTGTKSAPGCVIDMSASGSPASFSSFSPVSSTGAATWLEVRNGSIPGGWEWNRPPNAPSHLTLRNIDTTSNAMMKGGSDIAIIGGSVHNWDAGNHAAVFWFETDTTAETMPNITVQGVTFHDLTNSVSSNHLEIIRIDTGTSNVLIDGNRFYNNQESTSTIFITNVNTDPGDPHDITIQNNFFGHIPDAYYTIATQTPVVQTCLNIAVLYNSFADSPTTMSGCTSKVNTRIVGNVGPRGSGCESGASYSHNVWQYPTNTPCGSSDKVVVGASGETTMLGLTNASLGDMHLTAGSPAIGAGDPSSYPAVDYDRQTRPGTPDAGADQH